ncbi:hypothetical protein [Nostoc sp.]|uniref:hypothetical protein n=1 Tax=Nostoc sp. TaxID=1180 RepID=UPI002FF93F16
MVKRGYSQSWDIGDRGLHRSIGVELIGEGDSLCSDFFDAVQVEVYDREGIGLVAILVG